MQSRDARENCEAGVPPDRQPENINASAIRRDAAMPLAVTAPLSDRQN